MRRVVVLCSIFAVALLGSANAQRRADDVTPVAAPAKKGSAKAEKKAAAPKAGKGSSASKAAKKTEPDTRPILRRADDMAPIAAPAKEAPKKKRNAKKSPDGDVAQPAAAA